MTLSIISVALIFAVPTTAILVDRLLKFCWKDGRTREHRIARKLLIALSFLAVVGGSVVTLCERLHAERQSKQLAQALKQAESERNAQALTGRFETQEGLGQYYDISDTGSGFSSFGPESLLDIFRRSPLAKIAEQNSIISKTVSGKLLVSAKIRGRDGVLVEIIENEWKVSPPPRAWDRNYSTNALEVKDADGNVVFQIKLRTGVTNLPSGLAVLTFQGIFFDSDGNGVAFTRSPTQGFFLTVLKPNSRASMPEIKPLFRYPSSLHLGEFAD